MASGRGGDLVALSSSSPRKRNSRWKPLQAGAVSRLLPGVIPELEVTLRAAFVTQDRKSRQFLAKVCSEACHEADTREAEGPRPPGHQRMRPGAGEERGYSPLPLHTEAQLSICKAWGHGSYCLPVLCNYRCLRETLLSFLVVSSPEVPEV